MSLLEIDILMICISSSPIYERGMTSAFMELIFLTSISISNLGGRGLAQFSLDIVLGI